MAGISRRRLLGSAAGVAVASALPPALRNAVAARGPATLGDIKHIVVLMQENRSFDHYFGTMPGVRGFDDPHAITLSTGRSVFYQPDTKSPDGYLLPFHLDTRRTSSQSIPSTSHAFAVQHAAVNGGKMDSWLPAHRAADGDGHGPYTMGYYTEDDIPFQWALAREFTVCDAYFSSVLGPTWPNRLYHWSGTIDPGGRHGGPIVSNIVPSPYTWTTYPERLTAAGVSWHVYQQEDDYGCNPLEFFKAYQDAGPDSPLHQHGLAIGPADQFEYDARHDRLPTVSWIIPTSPQCEHPDYLPAAGADFVAGKLEAIAANPDVWAKTVVVLNYDENDGLFDHMVPPLPPAGTPDEFVNGLPIGAGIRVPCTIVSPWTRGGFVATEPFDHTSVLRLIEAVTGVRETNISAWRRRTFGDLTSALGLGGSAQPLAPLPPTKAPLWQAEYNVKHLPSVQIPGVGQTPPHQGGRSRLDETLTTHASDFPDGVAGSSFPGTQLFARNKAAGEAAPPSKKAYATGIVACTLSVIDVDTGKLLSTVQGPINPYGIVASADGGTVYMTESGADKVTVFSTFAGRITGTIRVGLYPHGIAASPDGRFLYVANTGPDTGPGGSKSVSVINARTNSVLGSISVGLAPQSVSVSPDSATLYVSCQDGLWIVDTASRRVRGCLPGLARAHGVTACPGGRHVYVANTWHDSVSLVDSVTHAVKATISVGKAPWNIAFRPDGEVAYVTNANSDTVSVIDTSRRAVVSTIPVGHIPTGITASKDQIWVTNNASSTVTKIDAQSLTVLSTTDLGLSTVPAGVVLV
ncbi:alkaline phosphatase family protein [Kutzneria chonburiensis]|uniref:phospholipase C n=1 Tax=Kutzneria chonburiensis TaxID=1483604 RepID=A0ABV6MYL0_9PSEU|nr:alkaline phosphatase family protein [Kutzneria chonburiensis]